MANEPITHNRTEDDSEKNRTEINLLSVQGNIFTSEGIKPFSLELEVRWIDEIDLGSYVEPKVKKYGIAGGGGNLQGVRDSVIQKVVLRVAGENLEVPNAALSGILNPDLSSGWKVNVTNDGSITLKFQGSAGERGYECTYIFRDLRFSVRQVKYGAVPRIDTFEMNSR